MSDTTRHVTVGWGPENPEFRERYPDITTKKHQTRDRKSKQAKKHKRYTNNTKNDLYSLRKKVDELKLKEELINGN